MYLVKKSNTAYLNIVHGELVQTHNPAKAFRFSTEYEAQAFAAEFGGNVVEAIDRRSIRKAKRKHRFDWAHAS